MHSFNSYVACENSCWGRFARRKVVPPRETYPAAKSEEKRLFSQANSYAEARKLNAKDFWETGPSGRQDLAVCFFWSYPSHPCFQWKVYRRSKVREASLYKHLLSIPLQPPSREAGVFFESNKLSQSAHRTNQSSALAVPYAFVTLVALSPGHNSNKIHGRDQISHLGREQHFNYRMMIGQAPSGKYFWMLVMFKFVMTRYKLYQK